MGDFLEFLRCFLNLGFETCVITWLVQVLVGRTKVWFMWCRSGAVKGNVIVLQLP